MTGAPTRTDEAAAVTAPVAAAAPEPTGPGGRLMAANRWFTVCFVAWTLLAVLVRPTRVPLAVVDLVVFAAGCLLYVVAYATAVSRSRTDAIGLGGLFFLADQAGPQPVRRSFWLWTSVQTVVAVAAAAVRPFTPLAFGVLVPILGLSLMGLWSARHGTFAGRADPQRPVRAAAGAVTAGSVSEADPAPDPHEPSVAPGEAAARSTDVPPSTRDGAGMEQNDRHG